MDTLEKMTERGDELRIYSSPKGLFFYFSGEIPISIIDMGFSPFEKGLIGFGNYIDIQVPNLVSSPEISDKLNSWLRNGFCKDKEFLGTQIIFKYAQDKKSYFSTFEIDNNSWIDYVKSHPEGDSFSREIFLGESKDNFGDAYLDMVKNVKTQ